MIPATVNPETCTKVYCEAESWILTCPEKLPDLFNVTEDASVVTYMLISFWGFILPFTIPVHMVLWLASTATEDH